MSHRFIYQSGKDEKNMTNKEINTFIETMEEFGDIWTVEQVKDVYGKKTLEEAIADRQSSHAKFADIIRTVINR
mgnify:FL=1